MGLFRLIYSFLYRSFLFLIPRFASRNGKLYRWYQDRNQSNPKPPNIKQSIWIHCASLGEFEQGRPVLESLRKTYPNRYIVLSFFSPSGYQVRKDYSEADWVTYLPFDLSVPMNDFIDEIDPSICILIKYELWPNMLNSLKQRKIPTLLIGAYFRETHHFFSWYGLPFRNMLHRLDRIFVQDQSSLTRLASIQIKNAILAGDPRLDRVHQIAQQSIQYPIVEAFCKDQKVWVWGSTWPADEDLLKHLLPHLPEGWKILLVPHEVDQGHIDAILKRFGDQAGLYSKPDSWSDKKIGVIDKMGMLAYLYRYGNLAYIGGGFGKGIHSIQEAFVYGLPVMFGPKYQSFREARMLISMQGAFSVQDHEDLLQVFKDLQSKATYEKARLAIQNFVDQNLGASNRILEVIQSEYLPLQEASPNQ